MSLLTGLVSYWKFDESSGNAADSYGVNTLTNNNTATYTTGIINNGTDLEASSSQYFSIADASQVGLDFTTDFSFSFWAKPETISGGSYVIAKCTGLSTQCIYRIILSSTTFNLAIGVNSSAGTSQNFTGITVPIGVFQHYVLTYDLSAGEASLYINGELHSTLSGFPTSLINSTSPFTIGSNADPSAFFDGVIDEVGAWSKVLTAEEVTNLYNGGTALQYPFSIITNQNKPTTTLINTTKPTTTFINQAKPTLSTL